MIERGIESLDPSLTARSPLGSKADIGRKKPHFQRLSTGSAAVRSANVDASVSTWKLLRFIDEAHKYDLCVADALRAHDIKFETLKRRHLPLSRICAAMNALATIAGPGIGVSLGHRWHLREFRIVGYALLSSRTYGEFSDYWMGHFDYLGIPLEFRSRVDPDGWALEMSARGCLTDEALVLCVAEACASVRPIYTQLTGEKMSDTRVELAIADESLAEQLSDALGVEVAAGCSRTALVSGSAIRATPVSPDQAVLMEMCEKQCGGIAPELEEDELLKKVRRELLLSCGRPPKLGDTAKRLGMSKRSFNRALQQRGRTYTELVHLYRRDLSFELLRTGELCAKKIAFALSFDGVESFRRAFRNWTGTTVNEWCMSELRILPPRQ